MDLKLLPKITKQKCILPLSHKNARDYLFHDLFKNTRDLYLVSILFNLQYSNLITNTHKNTISISKLQKLYKNFKGQTHDELIGFLHDLDLEIFESFDFNEEESILTFELNERFFDPEDTIFFCNISNLKGFKINAQKITIFILSLGPYARFIRLSQIVEILGTDFKTNKQNQRISKSIFDTLLKNDFIDRFSYDQRKQTYYFVLNNTDGKLERNIYF
ncbi:hypothetical protein AB6C49_18615 [Vibrio cyclitrophicus]